ncbi:glutamate receptor 2-like isoform X2 [Mercenaria mercenaria]|uniref:glutamate receptor 2-like isoform X2 n=1 Tax=Mercenaria mercenaria TaxID=6596 RepID=UPI00234F152F|nr:glutamate receptor 2-like isoform X2 [Mercenaria mercenaria]
MMTLLLKLCTIYVLCIVGVTPDRRDPMKIGVILDDKGERQRILAFAWSYFKGQFGSPNVKYTPADVIDISNNIKLISKLCDKMTEGSVMMIVDYHPTTYGSVQSYAHYLNLPTLVPGGTGSSAYDPYKYDISLLPPTIDAIVAVVKHFQWNTFVYYIFDTNDGLLRLQSLYQSFVSGDYYSPVIRARRISNVSHCYDILRKIDRSPPPKRIILDLSTKEAYESVLHQIVDVGMNRDGYHYILGGLGINELDLSTFVYGGVNITGFSIVDNVSQENHNILTQADQFDVHTVGEITVADAMVIDTVHVLLAAVDKLNKDIDSNREDIYTSRSKSRQRYSRYGGTNQTFRSYNCSGDKLQQSFDGAMVLKALKNVTIYGLTGHIEFDGNGVRQNYIFRVFQLEHKKPLREVGFWTPKGGFNTTLPKLEVFKAPTGDTNRTLRVVTIKEEPFVQFKKGTDMSGAPLVNGRYLEGYCIDLAEELQKTSSRYYDYYIDLVGDDNYGAREEDLGCWNGMIGELLSTHGCPNGTRKKADIAIAPLTINEERQRAVDFTKPFMKTGISIMIKKPDKEKPGVFSFMYPLSNQVWLCVMVAFVAVSLVLFFVGRWSPYEWSDLDPKGGSPINNFNLLNTFWFSLGALMQQGSDTFPRSYSGRIVGSAWWFFTLILISSYTANLAAFLTIERLTPPISGADDLVKKGSDIAFGTLKSGSSRAFFEDSKVSTYLKMWQYMEANFETVMVSDTSKGVEKVRNSKGKYAFLLESAYNVYHNQRKPCNTMKVGQNLDSKGYGVATPVNFYLNNQLNLAVLKLLETGQLMKLEQKWWYSKGMCGTNKKDATTSALTLSNVSGIFHILVGGLLLSMIVALCEYVIHQRIRKLRERGKMKKMKPQTVRIVKKEPLEALKEAGYSERENSVLTGYTSSGTAAATAPLVTFDSSKYSHTSSPEH